MVNVDSETNHKRDPKKLSEPFKMGGGGGGINVLYIVLHEDFDHYLTNIKKNVYI